MLKIISLKNKIHLVTITLFILFFSLFVVHAISHAQACPPNAACDNSGNISNLNFGINQTCPWFQCVGADCRIDGGFNDPIGSCTGLTPTPTPTGGGCVDDSPCPTGTACNRSGGSCTCSAGTRPGTCPPPTPTPTGGGCVTDSQCSFGFSCDTSGSLCTCQAGNRPGTCNDVCSSGNASILGPHSNTPGVIGTGNFDPNFGSGQASQNNWLIGGNSYPESFTTVNTGVIRTSYSYMTTTAKQNGITPIDITPFCGSGGLANCDLSSNPQFKNGVYIASGNLTLVSSSGTYTFPANENFVILVSGSLTIKTNIKNPVCSNTNNPSSVTFSVQNDINIDPSVGEDPPLVCPPLPNCNLEGFYSADSNFNIQGTNDCNNKQLCVAGAVVVNAGLTGGKLVNTRNLCSAKYPTYVFEERPDLVICAPDFIKHPNYIWQEIAP